MDIAFCVIDTKTNKLQFSGAYNSLCLIKKVSEEVGPSWIKNKSNGVNSPQSRKDGISAPLQSAVGNSQSAVDNRQSAKKSPMTNDLMTNDNKKGTLNYELIEIKGDRMPIGIYIKELTPFTNNEIQVQPGDIIYIFSDGYVDQFGGEKGKKFKSKSFKELLFSIHNKTMEEQKIFLDKTIEDWRGNLEQVDDILVIGIRI